MTVTPRGIVTPNDSDDWDLTVDLASMAVSIDNAIDDLENAVLGGANAFKGTGAQRDAFKSTAVDGMLWVDTDGIKMIWRKEASDWVPAVWDWTGTNTQMTGFAAPDGFKWYNTTDNQYYVRLSGSWVLPTSEVFCVLQKSTSQNLTTSQAPLIWDVEVVDAFGMHDNVTNNTRITAPIDGVYEVSAQIYNSNASGIGYLQARLNGSLDVVGSMVRGAGAFRSTQSISIIDTPGSVSSQSYMVALRAATGTVDFIPANTLATMILQEL